MYEGPAEKSEGEGGVTASWLSADDNGSLRAGLCSSYRVCLDESVLVLVTVARLLFALSGHAINHKIHAVLSQRMDGCPRP